MLCEIYFPTRFKAFAAPCVKFLLVDPGFLLVDSAFLLVDAGLLMMDSRLLIVDSGLLPEDSDVPLVGLSSDVKSRK